MKKILILTAFLGGCSADIYPVQYEKAKELCSANGGILRITNYNNVTMKSIECNNGATFEDAIPTEQK